MRLLASFCAIVGCPDCPLTPTALYKHAESSAGAERQSYAAMRVKLSRLRRCGGEPKATGITHNAIAKKPFRQAA